MDNMIQPSNNYTIAPNIEGGEKDYMLDENLNKKQQYENKSNVKKNILHIHTS
jgi:hypothetical protein